MSRLRRLTMLSLAAAVVAVPAIAATPESVADSADLTVTATSPNERVFVMVEIVKPDGSTVYNGGSQTESSTTVKIRKAPAGDYEVRIANNAAEIEPYTAFATLPVVPAAPAPAPAPQPGQPQQPPAAAPGATVSVVTRKLSARRLARLNGRANVVLKLKKGRLKKGKYTVAVAAKDSGRPIGASAPLTVRK